MNDVVLVAALESFYDDDIISECPQCHRTVFYRPHNAKHAVALICTECWSQVASHDDTHFVTNDTIAELRAQVAAGAEHDCGDWFEKGQCMLCDAVEHAHEHRFSMLREVRLPTGPHPEHTTFSVMVCTCGLYDLFPRSNYALVTQHWRGIFEHGMRELGWRLKEDA